MRSGVVIGAEVLRGTNRNPLGIPLIEADLAGIGVIRLRDATGLSLRRRELGDGRGRRTIALDPHPDGLARHPHATAKRLGADVVDRARLPGPRSASPTQAAVSSSGVFGMNVSFGFGIDADTSPRSPSAPKFVPGTAPPRVEAWRPPTASTRFRPPTIRLASSRASRPAIDPALRRRAVPESVLRDICFAASRAPTGSNRQQFRMIVLTDGDIAQQAKHLIAEGAQRLWSAKRRNDGYDEGSGITDDSPKARMARSMETYVDGLSAVPALILPTLIRHREPTSTEGASVYPAMQNLLLAARGLGYGGVVTMWHAAVEPQLRALLQIPDDVFLAATVTLGKPAGNHGPVRRRPLDHFVYDGVWARARHGRSTRPAPATPAPDHPVADPTVITDGGLTDRQVCLVPLRAVA